ncbi:MAG: hypothetical protein CMJ17_00070 [Phenylobacterium sp.]|nr:hypothetical protein [Phenylobacterium sp.]|tara:strand:- start:347 stop:529 length:183 start_codon:yes stop_codon:yes gene_type:complete
MSSAEDLFGLRLVTNEYLVRKLRERATDVEWTGGDEAEAERLRARATELERNCSKVEWYI